MGDFRRLLGLVAVFLATASCKTTSNSNSSAKEIKLNNNAGGISVVSLDGDKVIKRQCALIAPPEHRSADTCGCVTEGSERQEIPARDFLRTLGDTGNFDPLAPDTSPNSAKALDDNYNAAAEAAKTGNAQAQAEEQRLKRYNDTMHNTLGWLKALRKGCAEYRPYDSQYQWIAWPFHNVPKSDPDSPVYGKCVYLTATDCSLCDGNYCTARPSSSALRGSEPYACWTPGPTGSSGVVCVNGTVPEGGGNSSNTSGQCVYLTTTDCSMCNGRVCTATPSSGDIRGNKPYACWTPGSTGGSGVVCVTN